MNECFKRLPRGGLSKGGTPVPAGTRGPPIYRVVHANFPIFFIEFIIKGSPGAELRYGPDRSCVPLRPSESRIHDAHALSAGMINVDCSDSK